MALRPGSRLEMSSHFIPLARSSMSSASSSGDHLPFAAGATTGVRSPRLDDVAAVCGGTDVVVVCREAVAEDLFESEPLRTEAILPGMAAESWAEFPGQRFLRLGSKVPSPSSNSRLNDLLRYWSRLPSSKAHRRRAYILCSSVQSCDIVWLKGIWTFSPEGRGCPAASRGRGDIAASADNLPSRILVLSIGSFLVVSQRLERILCRGFLQSH